jgi:IS30 family transposase
VKREDEILRLRHDAKMSIRDIGQTLNVSPQTVQKVIKKHNVGTVDAPA